MGGTNDKKQNISALLSRIRHNDLFALGELMDLKTRSIQTIAYHVLRDTQLAENVVNEVMIALIQNVHSFKNERNINGWINTVTIHKAFDCLKKRKFEVFPGEDALALSPAVPCSEDALVDRIAVVQTLERLEDTERLVLVGKILNGETYAGISRKTGLSVKQVRTTYARARERFKALYPKDD